MRRCSSAVFLAVVLGLVALLPPLGCAGQTYYQSAVLTDGGILSGVGGVAVNSAGRLYVTSNLNSTSTQVVSLYSDGTAAGNFTAFFGAVARGVDVDSAGVIYVCDQLNNRLVLLTANGAEQAVYTGSGLLQQPRDVSVDPLQGDIYVALNNSGVAFLYSGGSVRMPVTAGFRAPVGLAFSNTTRQIYVTDSNLNRVYVLNQDGTPAFNFAATDGFRSVAGLDTDSAGNVFVCDTGNSRLVVFSSNGTQRQVITGLGLSSPVDVTLDVNGTVYVADSGRVLVLSTINPPTVYSPRSLYTNNGSFSSARGMVLDAAGDIFLVDNGSKVVELFPNDAQAAVLTGNGLSGAFDVAVDRTSGVVYVLQDATSPYITALYPNGVQKSAFGPNFGSNYGAAYVSGLAVDSAGLLYLGKRH